MISTPFVNSLPEVDVVEDGKHIEYLNIAAAFDTETSSFYDHGERRACMYIWMFGIGNIVTYGRTWEEFTRLLKILQVSYQLDSKSRRLVVYVHNLSYDWQFLRKHIKPDKVFALERDDPGYIISGGIMFKCSMKLSGGKSLANIGKDLVSHHIEKAVGDLDYRLIRGPTTPLTPRELHYCEYDIRVLLAYIDEKIEQDGSIVKIPLTNTGYVRNFCREKCLSRSNYTRYRNLISTLTVDAEEYEQLKRAFIGGFVHSNPQYTRQILHNVSSDDFTSSYPAVMCLEKFPMSASRKIEGAISNQRLEALLNTYCCLFDLELHDVSPRLWQDFPISSSKCYVKKNFSESNGRIVTAEQINLTVTELDYQTYREFYNWAGFKISNMRVYQKQYLPRAFVSAILDLYVDKTTLKGIESEEVNYMIKKNMLNAAYGMSVTDIVREQWEYTDNEYSQLETDVEKSLEAYNNSKKRFLFYPWGVWVTAHARRNLFDGIKAVGDDYIYADTDSVKYFNPERHQGYFDAYNKRIDEKIDLISKHYRIEKSKFRPKTNAGKEKPLGYWDFEGVYDNFKTLGAKRYMYSKGDSLVVTISGANKKNAARYLSQFPDPFERFDHGLVIPEDYAKRMSSLWIDEETEGDMKDYLGNWFHYHELSSVSMKPTEYRMTMSTEFKKFIDFILGVEERNGGLT